MECVRPRTLRAAAMSFLIIFLALSSLAPATPPTNATLDTTPDPLAEQYTFNSIYLTYDTLADVYYTLHDKTVATSAVSFGDPEAIALLETFIMANTGVRSAESVAFLQLNLREDKAGFMPRGARGTVTKLPWSSTQVRKVAALMHRYLQTNGAASALVVALQTRSLSVKTAFSSLTHTQHEVFVSP